MWGADCSRSVTPLKASHLGAQTTADFKGRMDTHLLCWHHRGYFYKLNAGVESWLARDTSGTLCLAISQLAKVIRSRKTKVVDAVSHHHCGDVDRCIRVASMAKATERRPRGSRLRSGQWCYRRLGWTSVGAMALCARAHWAAPLDRRGQRRLS